VLLCDGTPLVCIVHPLPVLLDLSLALLGILITHTRHTLPLAAMLFPASLAFLLVGASSIAAAPSIQPASRALAVVPASSTALPVAALPFQDAVYSQAAGLCQQTYCVSQPIGQVVGDAKLLSTYGNGVTIQRANIYYSKSLGVVLGYQGTNTSSVPSDLYDADFVLTLPDARLGLPVGALVDMGFQNAWLASYADVLPGIVAARSRYPKAKLTVVGHSLGASQALLAGLALQKLYGVNKVVTCECPCSLSSDRPFFSLLAIPLQSAYLVPETRRLQMQ
jgi:hypothetical protein